jgi:hypothetical protein
MRALLQELGLRGKNLVNSVKLHIKFLSQEMKIYLKNSIQKTISHLD